MKAYVNPSHPGSFSGLDSIRRDIGVDTTVAREWLMGENSYILHKQSKIKFCRRRSFAKGINELWQADLVDLSLLSKENDSQRYLLTCIDVFSKYARVEPLKNKSGSTITTVFMKMIETQQCKLLQTDKGTEFLNEPFQKLLREKKNPTLYVGKRRHQGFCRRTI